MTGSGTIREVREAIRRGDRSAVEICEEALARIRMLDPALHAFNTVAAAWGPRSWSRLLTLLKSPVSTWTIFHPARLPVRPSVTLPPAPTRPAQLLMMQ